MDRRQGSRWIIRLGKAAVLAAGLLALGGARADEAAGGAVLPPFGPCAGRSVSIGRPDHGRLRCGQPLRRFGPHHYLQPYTQQEDYRWGTSELVAGLQWIADRVAETAGVKRIAIGNLSKRGGGDHPLSHSHESGRDVDLPFLMMTDSGKHVESLYHAFDDQGVSRNEDGRGFRFDTARNWLLVAAILECPEVEVAGIVVAPGLRGLLLEHARQSGADAALIDRAARGLIAPPRGAKPHDNHFHLRIRCPADDVPLGCVEGPW